MLLYIVYVSNARVFSDNGPYMIYAGSSEKATELLKNKIKDPDAKFQITAGTNEARVIHKVLYTQFPR